MNDEQQLWKDVQKFMNQFPGFVAIARKIGDIGSLTDWQASEQHKLEALTQEVEKQRAAIVAEREAANNEAARRLQESEYRLQHHAQAMESAKIAMDSEYNRILDEAKSGAAKIVAEAQSRAQEVEDALKSKRKELDSLANIHAEVLEAVKETRVDLRETSSALEKVREEHASFLKKIGA